MNENEKEPVMVRYAELTPKGRKILAKVEAMLGEGLLEKIRNSDHRLLMKPKWNNLAQICEDLELYVRKDGKVCLDIVDLQGIIGEAIREVEDDVVAVLSPFLSKLETLKQKRPKFVADPTTNEQLACAWFEEFDRVLKEDKNK